MASSRDFGNANLHTKISVNKHALFWRENRHIDPKSVHYKIRLVHCRRKPFPPPAPRPTHAIRTLCTALWKRFDGNASRLIRARFLSIFQRRMYRKSRVFCAAQHRNWRAEYLPIHMLVLKWKSIESKILGIKIFRAKNIWSSFNAGSRMTTLHARFPEKNVFARRCILIRQNATIKILLLICICAA